MKPHPHTSALLLDFDGNSPTVDSSAFIAPTASLIGNVAIASGASIWFGCVLRGDVDRIQVGRNSSIQDLSVCHTDKGSPLSVGNGVTVGHRCILHGCSIEDGCLIGMGAIIMNDAVVGRGSIVAAGAIILENTVIPPFSLVAGVPGDIKRSLSEDEVLPKTSEMTRTYRELAAKYIGIFHPCSLSLPAK